MTSGLASVTFKMVSKMFIEETLEGQCTARLRSLNIAIGGSSKDVLYFTLCVFSALQS